MMPDLDGWSVLAALRQDADLAEIPVIMVTIVDEHRRGVALGADLPHSEWEKRIDHALTNFAIQPTILQQFHKGSLFEHPYYDGESEVRTMKGRIRLCPYYFVEDDRVKLRGALTTIVPADKKLIHGMRDGILVPTSMNTVNGPRS
jgi:hypothetical protein